MTALAADLSKLLKGTASKFDATQTKQFLILPILAALGWDVFSPAEVWPNHKISKTKTFDFLLKGSKESSVLLEVLPLHSLGDASVSPKLVAGLQVESSVFLVVRTDGRLWQLLVADDQGRFDAKLEIAVNLSLEDGFERLSALLSKSCVRSKKAAAEARRIQERHQKAEQLRKELPSALSKIPEDLPVFGTLASYCARYFESDEELVVSVLRPFLAALSQPTRTTKPTKPSKSSIKTLDATTLPTAASDS